MGRRAGLDDLETLAVLRVLSLSCIDEQPEKSVDALLDWIRGLQIRIETLERQINENKKVLSRAGAVRCLVGDLEAENRTLRIALNDSLSEARASVRPATTALVADTAPTASKAKDEENG